MPLSNAADYKYESKLQEILFCINHFHIIFSQLSYMSIYRKPHIIPMINHVLYPLCEQMSEY